MRIERWFREARKRTIPEPLHVPGKAVNLGAGKTQIEGATPYDLETGWDANTDLIPENAGSVATVWMHGFLDYVDDPVAVLRECARVLQVGGVINIVLPHAMAELGSSDIHKKTRWTEESFKFLLENPYYGPRGGDLPYRIQTQFIIGVVWRNLSLFTQLVRTADE